MVKFKNRVIKIGSNKHISESRKKEKWKSLTKYTQKYGKNKN